ncbi:MAG: aminotransferase class V-fold PLP-dependent enzyme [Lachnospiraceae bacterium]|nr:aminotransferase class V-fold PLP-dependent enzyme [Lachnospiraceae bacterium]
MQIKDYKLFTIGPAQMYPSTLEVRGHVVPYFRTPEFSELMLDNKQLMIELEKADPDSEFIVLTASGSGAMEATVINCFDKNDRLLIVCGGTFGERFVKICEIHGIPHEVIRLGQDEVLVAEHFAKYDDAGITGVLVNIDETYTGQLYDIAILHDYCERNGAYLVVDAISSFLCDPYDAGKYAVDATIVSSQKGLCLAPGLSFVTLSPRMTEKVLKTEVQSLYFDFKDYILNMKRGQTPFTPAVGVCFELNDMLRKIKEQGGVDERVREVRERAEYFRSRIAGMPVFLPDYPLSNAISPIRFEKDIAMEFFAYLKDNRDIMVNPVGGELGKRSIRVSHVGDLKNEDYDELIAEIKGFFKI